LALPRKSANGNKALKNISGKTKPPPGQGRRAVGPALPDQAAKFVLSV
jgi:hypothetical protein